MTRFATPTLQLLAVARRRPARTAAVLATALLLLAAAVVFTAKPFGGADAASIDNGTPSSLTTVERRSLSSQTQTDATLAYADPSTIVAAAGTALPDLQQAEQALASAKSALHTAQQVLASDRQTLDEAKATLAASRAKETSDCRGDAAAAAAPAGTAGISAGRSSRPGQGAPSSSPSTGGTNAASPCADATTAVADARQTVTADSQKVMTDQGQVAAAQTSLAGAERAATTAQASATIDDAGSVYTALPAIGAVVRRGVALYAVDGQPIVLFYGTIPAWRAFRPGMAAGRDIAELNANLAALGYGEPAAGATFTAATGDAIRAFQAAHDLPRTGILPLGAVVFEAGAVRVTSVAATLGQPVQPGPVLGVTSLQHQVTIALDASEQSNVRVGDRVTVTLPDNTTTPGVVSSVGTVATAPSTGSSSASTGGSGGSGNTTPTIEVDVRLLQQEDAGRLDQAPVQVSITTASARSALVVPVDALLALTDGGYALEAVSESGNHQLEAVEVGLFDDAHGLVQVSGPNVRAGQRVVVPSS